MALLSDFVSMEAIEHAIRHSPIVAHGLMEKAKEVQAFWVDYWNSIPHPYARVHTLASGYVEHSGDYAKSIRIKFMKSETGMPKARVQATDYKSWWIEYGSAHMPEFAPRAATLAHFGGTTTVSA